MKRLVITEDQKREILAKHTGMEISDIVIINEWLTPDDKYLILFDNLIDIEEKKWYGNIWENVSNLVVFLDHLYEKSNLNQTIKEGVKHTLSKFILNENRVDLRSHLPEIRQYMLNEGMWDDIKSGAKWVGSKTKDFVVDTAKSTYKGVKDFAVTAYEGGKEFLQAVRNGDFAEIIRLLKKGAIYLARKVRQALYSTAGMIVDAILIATGVGKAAQFVVWAIVVALGIYELSTGDYEHPDDPMWMRILFFGVDIFAMVTAAAAAKPFRGILNGMKGASETAVVAKASKPGVFRSMLESIKGVLGKVASLFERAMGALKNNWVTRPIGNFLGKWVGKLGGLLERLGGSIGKYLKAAPEAKQAINWGKGVKAGVGVGALLGGLHLGVEGYKEYKIGELEKEKKGWAPVSSAVEAGKIEDALANSPKADLWSDSPPVQTT
jgi:hypothetical protein